MLKDKGGLMPALVLVIICSITAALLSWTNVATAETIAFQKAQKDELTRGSILSEASHFEKIDLNEFVAKFPEYAEESAKSNGKSQLLSLYKGVKEEATIGYIFEGAYRGYGGNVPVMVGITTDGKVAKVKVLTNEETPGLGKKVEEEAFLNQFSNADAKKPFAIGETKENEVRLDTVSGATISSKAVKETVNLGMEIYSALEVGDSNE